MLIDNERAILFRSHAEHDDFERWLAATPWGVAPRQGRVHVDWPRVYCLYCASRRRVAEGRDLPDGCNPYAFLQRLSWDDLHQDDRHAFWFASTYGVNAGHDMDELCALARRGQPVALHVLGLCHRDGMGVPVNAEAGFRCLRTAYELGDANAAWDLASALLEGTGTGRDPILAAELFHEAVVATTGEACAKVGAALADGRFGWVDLPLSELFLRRAAALRSREAADLLIMGQSRGIFPETGDMDSLLSLAGPDIPARGWRVGRRLVEAALSARVREELDHQDFGGCDPAATARHLMEITRAHAPADIYDLGMRAIRQSVSACPDAVSYYNAHRRVTLSDGTAASMPELDGPLASQAQRTFEGALERLPLRAEADRQSFVEFVEASPFHPGTQQCPQERVNWEKVFLLWRASQRRAQEGRAITPDRMFGYLLRAFRHEPSAEDARCDELAARWERGEVNDAMRGLLRLAERGHPKALFYIARCFDEGIGLNRDTAASRVCLVDAYEGGYTPAALSLAVSLLEDANDEQTRLLAAIHFEEAFIACDPVNLGRVGVALMQGTFGRADRWDGELNLRRAAALGDPMACCFLARAMREGKIPNTGDSHDLLRLAASRRYPRGQYLLALDFLDAAVDGDLRHVTSLSPDDSRAPADLFARAAALLEDAAREGHEEAARLCGSGRRFTLSNGASATLPRLDIPPRQ